MAESFEQLSSLLGIKTISVDWNDPFPFDKVLTLNNHVHNIRTFLGAVRKKYPDAKINNQDLGNIGILAESFDIMLAYFITGNNTIDLVFHDGLNTKEWMDQFKGQVCRRQFFNLIHSYRNFKPYHSLFPFSTFYNLYSSNLPIQCNKVNTYILNKEYIVIQYLNDAGSPDYRVIKPGEVFSEFIPLVTYNPSNFNSIKFEFDNKVFIGDCVKYLFDGIEREYGNIDEGSYHIDPREGTVWCDEDSLIEYIPRFKKDPKITKLLSVVINNKKVVLLSNATLWVLPDNQFIPLVSIPGLKYINQDIFSISSEDKGIMVSLEPNTMECVPQNIFVHFLVENIVL